MGDMDTSITQNNDVYKTLLESTKAIPWRIDWKTMRFSYIGPQIEKLLGWSPEAGKRSMSGLKECILKINNGWSISVLPSQKPVLIMKPIIGQ